MLTHRLTAKSDSITIQHETSNRVKALHILVVSSSAGTVQVRGGLVVMHSGHLSCQGYPEGLCAEHQLLGQS